jgi:preprotein translocase subunit SecG
MDGFCTGFAVNPKAPPGKQCILYTGKIEKVDSEVTLPKEEKSKTQRRLTSPTGWECFTLTMEKADVDVTTPEPSPMQALEDLTQNLHLRQVLAGAPVGMTTARMVQISPKKGEEGCFKSSWWFTMQDDNGTMASIPVAESDWPSMMAMLPAPKPVKKPVDSSIVIDRVLVKTCNPKAGSWGRECIMPKVNNVCDHRQIMTSIITGIIVPVCGWILVNVAYKLLPSSARSTSYDSRLNGGGGDASPSCTTGSLIILCIVAVIACIVLAAGTTALIGAIFGSAGCLHGSREIFVISCATALPAALAMIIGLAYIARSSKEHATREEKNQSQADPQATKPRSQFMVVKVEEGSRFGTPVDPQHLMHTGHFASAGHPAFNSGIEVE